MNTHTNLDIDTIFYPGWLMVCQLRGGAHVHDGKALYRQAGDLVKDAQRALSQAGFAEASCEHMLYAYCALLDETVLSRTSLDDGYLIWRQDPLQARFFGTLNAGEELWERIRRVLNAPTPDKAVLTCLLRTLQLGFVGQYRLEDDERREDMIRRLSEHVPPFDLAENAPVVIQAPAPRLARHAYWFSWGMGALMLVGLWFALSSILASRVSSIVGLE